MSCYILFMVAHFYATWGLFIPTAIILGIGAAPLWTSKGQYLNIVRTPNNPASLPRESSTIIPPTIFSRPLMILPRKPDGQMMPQRTCSLEYSSSSSSQVSTDRSRHVIMSPRPPGTSRLVDQQCGVPLSLLVIHLVHLQWIRHWIHTVDYLKLYRICAVKENI